MNSIQRRLHAITCWKDRLDRLASPHVSDVKKSVIREQLAAQAQHPWCLPIDTLPTKYADIMTDIVGKKPPLPYGDVLLVGVKENRGHIMRLSTEAHTPAHGIALVQTQEAWEKSQPAAERAIPYILNSRLDDTPLAITRLFDTNSVVLDGNSYGLAFAISHASRALARPVPSSVVALAAIDDHGNTRAVGALPRKIQTVLKEALNIHTILVTPGQEEEARTALRDEPGDDLHIVAVDKVRTAIDVIWPDLQEYTDKKLQDSAFIDGLVDDLYLDALESRNNFTTWHPVIRTLRGLLKHGNLAEQEDIKARFALSIALRHEGKGNEQAEICPSPDAIIQAERRRDYHAKILAHMVQAASDAGQPLRSSLRKKMQRLQTNVEADTGITSDALKALGAYARVLNRDGQAKDAFTLLSTVLQEWWHYGRDYVSEASHPLCALFHSTELLRDPNALKKAEAELKRFEGRGLEMNYWIHFSHARALLALDQVRTAATRFGTISEDESIPPFVRFSTIRWQWRCTPQKSAAKKHLEHIQQRMCDIDGNPDNNDLVTFSHLSLLDYGLAYNEPDTTRTALSALRETSEGQLFCLLEHAAPDGISSAQWVANAYPY